MPIYRSKPQELQSQELQSFPAVIAGNGSAPLSDCTQSALHTPSSVRAALSGPPAMEPADKQIQVVHAVVAAVELRIVSRQQQQQQHSTAWHGSSSTQVDALEQSMQRSLDVGNKLYGVLERSMDAAGCCRQRQIPVVYSTNPLRRDSPPNQPPSFHSAIYLRLCCVCLARSDLYWIRWGPR